MSKEFEEAKLVITADIVFDPDGDEINYIHKAVEECVADLLFRNFVLHKNLNVKLESFICGK